MTTARSGPRARRAITALLVLAVIGVVRLPATTSGATTPASPPSAREDVFTFGDAPFRGSTGSVALAHPIVGLARTPTGMGYDEVASDGGVFSYGDAAFYGSTGAIHLNRPIVGIAITPGGHGYWLVASDGGIFAFGDAAFYGSTGAIHLNRPIVGMAPTPTGHGYWLVADDGGIFAFGDARFAGSTAGLAGAPTITGMAATPTGHGYWLVAGNGGVFTFGDAGFFGSAAASSHPAPATGIAATPSGKGYWLARRDGGVFAYGDATYDGSMGATTLAGKSVVGIAPSVSGHGYSMVAARATSAPTSETPPTPTPPARPFDVPSSRRIVVTFKTAFTGPDSMIVHYYEHDGSHILVYTCTNPKESFANYSNGFDETWASVGNCSSGPNHSNAMAAKFETPFQGPKILFFRIFYSPSVSYRFSCIGPGVVTSETTTYSTETWESAGMCFVDQSTPESSACGRTDAPPAHYQHVVVIMEENRTWSEVGGVGFGAMPYAHDVAQQCTYYGDWQETNPTQDSLPQYIGLTSGVDNPAVYDNCAPSSTCRSTDDNIFRQVRDAAGTARTFVEGATGGCDGSNHVMNVPALYYYGGNDHSFCNTEVRPLTEMNVNALPTFSMIIPTLCDNGHSCGNDVADAWLRLELRGIMTGSTYLAGKTAIFVIYDEDRPMPDLVIAPTAHRGEITSMVANHNDALRTFDELLGLPILPSVSSAVSLRASAHI